MKKPAIASIIVLVILALLTIYPAGALAGEKVNVKFWHALSGSKGQVLNEIIRKFHAENPDIVIEAVYVKSHDKNMGNDYHSLYKRILESIARKNPPDMAQVFENWVCQLTEVGAIVPVEDFIGKPGGISEKEIDDLLPIFRKSNTFEGKLWTLPFSKSIFVLYYNRDMFKSAGMKPPGTWNEFRETAGKLTVKEGNGTVRYGAVFEPSVDLFGHYLFSYDGDFFKNGKAIFNDQVGIDDMKFWVDMVNKDQSALLSFNERDDFLAGRSAMYIDTSSQMGFFNEKAKFDWGVTFLPRGTTRKYQLTGTNIAIFSNRDKNKQMASLKFINFMFRKDISLFWTMKTGYLPLTSETVKSSSFQELINKDSRYNVGIQALEYAVVQPKVSAWEMIRGIVNDAMYEALSLRKSPTDALDWAVNLSNNLIQNLSGQCSDLNMD